MILPNLTFAEDGTGKDCGLRPDPFEGMSNITRFLCERALRSGDEESIKAACVNNTNAGWNSTRDNSMSPANDDVGRSMAVMLMGNKISQGIQVCPGVYLATAHGTLNGNPDVDPKSLNIRAVAYPFVPDNLMTSTGDRAQFVSPRLRSHPNYDPSKMESLESDYVFIKVDNPVRPNSFIEPVESTHERIIEATDNGSIDVNLYRGKTRYTTQDDGTTPVIKEVTTNRGTHLELDQDGWATDLGYMMNNVYTEPMRVNTKCTLSPAGNGGINSNCPTEQSVSGSPYISNINGRNSLIGIHNWGTNNYSQESTAPTGGFVPSNQFCSDYSKVCGKPCNSLPRDQIRSASL